MTGHGRWLVPLAIIAFAGSAGCNSPRRRAVEAAENTSELAASAKQQELWQGVAKNGDVPGLDRVPVVQNPVEQRNRPAQPGASSPVPPQQISIPAGIQSSIRITEFPVEPAKPYDGPATVVDASGDRIRVDLGATRTLTLLARAGGKPIPVTAKETVRITYLQRRGPRDQRTAIGIRTATGAGIVQAAENGENPIDFNVPLFNVNAKQLGSDPATGVRVIAGPGVAPVVLQPGQIEQVGDVTVFVVGSAGVAKGAPAAQIGAKPYALNVMVWKVP